MANQETNNMDNVSTTRFIKGGYAFVAPKGTAVPTDLTTAIDVAKFKCMGFFSEDGWKESIDTSEETIKDANGDIVDTYQGSCTETIAMTLIEISETALGVQFGSENVSKSGNVITVDHNWSKSGEELAVILEMVLKNGRRWRKVIPACKVTERGEITANSTTTTGREITLTYLTDDSGSGAKDYIQVGGTTATASEPSTQSAKSGSGASAN